MCIPMYKHTHTRLLLRHKKEWNFAICINMDGLEGYYAKWKTNTVWYCFYAEPKKMQSTSEYKKDNTEYKLVVTSGEGKDEGKTGED